MLYQSCVNFSIFLAFYNRSISSVYFVVIFITAIFKLDFINSPAISIIRLPRIIGNLALRYSRMLEGNIFGSFHTDISLACIMHVMQIIHTMMLHLHTAAILFFMLDNLPIYRVHLILVIIIISLEVYFIHQAAVIA